MDSIRKWINLAAPAGWDDVIARTIVVAVANFAVLHLKEYIDAGQFDTLEIFVDTLWVMGGTSVLNAFLYFLRK